MYGIAQWYIHTQKGPQILGASFIPEYAEYLGVNPQQTMDSLIGIGVRQFRLVSYWNAIEPTPGHYDFKQLDWQFKKAEAAGAKVTLSLGLRQPRWPECHAPSWVDINKPTKDWQPQLEKFMTQVVDRYKDSPALQSYQVENEFFLVGFGNCPNKERSRLVSEYNLVKRLDPHHKVIINRSNNGLGIPVGAPKPDEYGVSIYKRVWDAQITHRYFEYPMPAWYYAFLAGVQKLHDGNDMIVHELQAEAWGPDHKSIKDISLDEQNKSLNAQRLEDRFEYGKATGMREIYLWGAEYWYYRKAVLNDPSLWNVAKQEFNAPQ
jgi:beta-galactosidase GanA